MQSSKSIDIKKGSSNSSRSSHHRRNPSWPPVEFRITPPTGSEHPHPGFRAGRNQPTAADDPWSFFVTSTVEDNLLDDVAPEDAVWHSEHSTGAPTGRPSTRRDSDLVVKPSLTERWDSFITKRQSLANNPPHRYVDNALDSDESDSEEGYIWPNTLEADILDRTPSPDPTHRRPKSLTDTSDSFREHRERRARKKYKRTLSGHRRSWHEPSVDLFPVSETASEYRVADDADHMSLGGGKPMSRSAVELGGRARL